MKLDNFTSQTIFQQSPISTQIFSPTGESLMANKAWEKLWGVKHTQALGYNVLEDEQLVQKGTMPYIKRGFAGETVHIPAIKYEPPKTVKIKGVVPYKYVSAVIYPVKNSNGKIVHVVLQHNDITEQIVYENKLRESELRYKSLTSFAPVGIFQTDSDGNCLYVNKKWCDYAGMTQDEAKGKGWLKALYPDDKKRVFREWYEAAEKKREFVSEYRFRTKDGKVTWLQGNAIESKDASGRITGFLGTVSDITDKKVSEEKLSFQANILTNITDSVITTDMDGNITYWNKEAEYIFGYKEDEMLGKSPLTLYTHVDKKQFAKDLKNIIKGKDYVGEWEGKRKDGRIIWVDIKTTLLTDNNNKPIGFIGVANDITERKIIEAALKESEERLRLALNAGNVGVWDWDIANNHVTWSDKMFEIYGVSKEKFKGTEEEFMRLIYPEDQKIVKLQMQQALADKKPYRLEFRVYGSGNKVIWVAVRAQVLYDQKNKPIRMLGATIDITKRKQLEKQKDEFIGLVSHELKTPVTSIKVFTQVLERSFAIKGDDSSAKLLKKMDVQINKLTMLIGDLLDITRIEEGKLAFRKSYFDFNELVKEIAEEVQRTTEKQTIVMKLAKTKSVYKDRERYGQVIINLLTNALKYSASKKEILITTREKNHELLVSVTDYGIGIPKDKQKQIFERFYRVSNEKDTYPGLGLGLYITKEIIERQGGKILVESEEGKGSTFTFSVPLEKRKS